MTISTNIRWYFGEHTCMTINNVQ